jgi:ABC-2 type transport system permease protein
MTALAALTERVVRKAVLDMDLVFAAIVPVVTLIGATVALRNVIDTGGMSYTQYVLPAIVVQAMLFGALTTTDRAAHEQASGFGVRLRTLPISPLLPLTARMMYCLIRGACAVAAALITAYVMGFRMQNAAWSFLAFIALSLTLTLALSLGADVTGARAKRTEVASQLLLIPQLLLVLLSTGMAPLQAFPSWLHPFVQYQPVSQVTETLRGFTSGHIVAGNLAASLAWCLGLLAVFGAMAIRMQRRTL